jgi:MATE family multidrug resistance protein
MYASVLMGISIMVVPPLIAVEWFDAGVYTVWVFIVAYLVAASVVFYRRFRLGAWKSMRVIEEAAPAAEATP